MSLDSLKQRRVAGESVDRELGELEDAIDSAFALSRELVALGQPSSAGNAVVDINELVAQLGGVLGRLLGSKIRLSLELSALDAIVEADPAQLEWVLLNLAFNGREAMPDGGTFTIQTSSFERQAGSPSRPQRYVRVTVLDTGHGLFGEARTRPFDPFVSTKEGASGLGLTSVAMIVRSFQGWLHIESDRSGTRVHIHLPTVAARGR